MGLLVERDPGDLRVVGQSEHGLPRGGAGKHREALVVVLDGELPRRHLLGQPLLGAHAEDAPLGLSPGIGTGQKSPG
jgi:hypothetical protein